MLLNRAITMKVKGVCRFTRGLMVCDRLLSTKVNCLCDKEDTYLRQERLNKVKQVSQDYMEILDLL